MTEERNPLHHSRTYVRRTNTCQAVQFSGKNMPSVKDFAGKHFSYLFELEPVVHSPTGDIVVSPGDWVVTAGGDDFYVSTDENFRRIYAVD